MEKLQLFCSVGLNCINCGIFIIQNKTTQKHSEKERKRERMHRIYLLLDSPVFICAFRSSFMRHKTTCFGQMATGSFAVLLLLLPSCFIMHSLVMYLYLFKQNGQQKTTSSTKNISLLHIEYIYVYIAHMHLWLFNAPLSLSLSLFLTRLVVDVFAILASIRTLYILQ